MGAGATEEGAPGDGAATCGCSGRGPEGAGVVAGAVGDWGALGDGAATCGSRRSCGGTWRATGGFGGESGGARSGKRRSTLLCPRGGRAGTASASCRGGAETMRGAGVGVPGGPAFRSRPAADSGPECDGRVTTTDRFRLSSGGRAPRPAVGTKLAGVAMTWGAAWVGRRSFTSTWEMRAAVMGPRPKRFSLTTTTAFRTLVFR